MCCVYTTNQLRHQRAYNLSYNFIKISIIFTYTVYELLIEIFICLDYRVILGIYYVKHHLYIYGCFVYMYIVYREQTQISTIFGFPNEINSCGDVLSIPSGNVYGDINDMKFGGCNAKWNP